MFEFIIRFVASSKTIWSPQAGRTKIFDFFPHKSLKTDIKKGIAEPFFQFLVLKCPFLRIFYKYLDTFLHFISKPWDPSKTLGAATPPSLNISVNIFYKSNSLCTLPIRWSLHRHLTQKCLATMSFLLNSGYALYPMLLFPRTPFNWRF